MEMFNYYPDTYQAADCYFALQQFDDSWEVIIVAKHQFDEDGCLDGEDFEVSGNTDLELCASMENCYEVSLNGETEFTFEELKKHCEDYGLTFNEELQKSSEEWY